MIIYDNQIIKKWNDNKNGISYVKTKNGLIYTAKFGSGTNGWNLLSSKHLPSKSQNNLKNKIIVCKKNNKQDFYFNNYNYRNKFYKNKNFWDNWLANLKL